MASGRDRWGANFFVKCATFSPLISLMTMKKHTRYKHSLSIMTGLAAAISVGIGIAGVQVVASIELETPTVAQVSEADSGGGYTVVYKDPDGPWPGGGRAPGTRVVEVISGVFIDRDKGFDI